jgi:hypothetical protein
LVEPSSRQEILQLANDLQIIALERPTLLPIFAVLIHRFASQLSQRQTR